MVKVCSKCKVEKTIENFNKDKSSKDGYFCWCKQCVSENGKSRNFPVGVEEKKCPQCGVLKESNCFNKNKRNKSGLSSLCRECESNNYQRDRDKIIPKQAEYNRRNPEVHKKAATKYYQNNTELVKARSATHYSENREEILDAQRGNPIRSAKKRQRRLDNLEESLRKEKILRDKRRATKREHINKLGNEWAKKKATEDPNFKLAKLLRSRLTKAIKRDQRDGSAVRDLGCSIEDLKKHLESKFQPGMTWKNWGQGDGMWNIDHIMPISCFNLADRQHLILACNYLNLQPLWFLENMKKGKKIIPLENMPTEFPSLLSNPSMPFAGTSPPVDELIFL